MININKKYKTKDGLDVKLYDIIGKGLYPVIGVVLQNGIATPKSWSLDGKYDVHNTGLDLIEENYSYSEYTKTCRMLKKIPMSSFNKFWENHYKEVKEILR